MNANHESLLHMYNDIPNYNIFVKLESIKKGMSGDKKYRVETIDGQLLLLRVSDIQSYERKKKMYDMMERASTLGVSMSHPVDFGICNDGKNVYQLLSWCDGETADIVLPSLSKSTQYTLGLKAGQNLKLIHTIPAPDEIEDWYERFISANDARIRAFSNCGVPIQDGNILLNYYENNRYLLHRRPQCFIHSDYHNENLLISENHDIAVVDWDLLDSLYGDPWLEFNRIPMCNNFSPYFATGLLRGYFGGEPPEEFWRVLALYLSTGALMLVSRAVYNEPEHIEECMQNAVNVMQWFNGMRNPIPEWYLKDFVVEEM